MSIRNLVALTLALTLGNIATATARTVPISPEQIAQPGGRLPGNPRIALVKVAEGFADPINVAHAGDGSQRIFVVERAGRIKVVDAKGRVQPEPFLDLTRLRPTTIDPVGNDVQSEFIEQGLYSVAFHPRYAENGFFYVHYASVRANGAGIVARFQVDPAKPDTVSAARARATETPILRIEQPSYNNNGGQIAFGPDGMLYIGLGDGGWSAPENASQELSTRLGKILRIDVDRADPYVAPRDNPFASSGGTPQDEIWATGLHNPYKFAFDPASGDLFVADVGDSRFEEINYVAAGASAGGNFGWPKMEGAHCHTAVNAPKDAACEHTGQLPIAGYAHPDKSALPDPQTGALACASVQGLGVANYGGMERVYLVGDWCSGHIFGVGWDGTRWQLQEMLKTDLHITAGGLDEAGNVLVLSAKFYFDEPDPKRPPYGTVWRVVTADDVPAGAVVAPTKP